METHPIDSGAERRRKVRRSALLLGLLAFGFYVAFIIASLMRGAS